MTDPIEDYPGLSKPGCAKGKLQRAALDWLRQKEARGEIPTSIRFVFYELGQRGVVSKRSLRLDGRPSKRKPDTNLSEAITVLREVGLVPWEWIEDESRDVCTWNYAPTVAEYVADRVEYANIDRWPGVSRPVIVAESRAVAGTLERTVALDYLVSVVPCGGQCTGFLVTKAAPLLKDPRTRVLYLGDRDLCGNDIEAHTRDVLERHAGRAFDEDTWERLLLTEAQARDLRRRGVKPVRKTDHRFRDGRPHDAFEAEALGQRVLTDIVRGRLVELAPAPLDRVLAREVRQRRAVKRSLGLS
jgi:hypothetical protein